MFDVRQWTTSRQALGPIHPPLNYSSGALSLGISQPKCEDITRIYTIPTYRKNGTLPPCSLSNTVLSNVWKTDISLFAVGNRSLIRSVRSRVHYIDRITLAKKRKIQMLKTTRTASPECITIRNLRRAIFPFFLLKSLHTPGLAILSHSLAGHLGGKAKVKTYPRQLNSKDSFTSWCLSAKIKILVFLSFSFKNHRSEPTVRLPVKSSRPQ